VKVLIAEDSPNDRKLLKVILEAHGCTVVEAEDGRQGFELAASHQPDLIVSDAMMPAMDGFQFLRKVKSDETLRDIPFVFYSAIYTGSTEKKLALSLGAETVIVKPRSPKVLWNDLMDVFERSKQKIKPRPQGISTDEEEYLKSYSSIVVAKLEEKIRELEESREKLETSEKRYKDLFDSSRDGIFQVDDGGIITLVNPATAEMFGYSSPDEMAGRPVIECWADPGKREAYLTELERVQAVSSFYLRAKKKGGELFDIEISSRMLKDDSGNFLGLEGIIRDITERKTAEDDLIKKMEELEKFYEMAVGRELRMKELKEQNARLQEELARYEGDGGGK
jgi:PAS domain S-box-containing protein